MNKETWETQKSEETRRQNKIPFFLSFTIVINFILDSNFLFFPFSFNFVFWGKVSGGQGYLRLSMQLRSPVNY